MGNILNSLVSGFTKAISDIFGAPLDFLSGKTCSSVCGSTWDLICYVENFCVANLLKVAAILFLFYIVLVFFYLLYKVGICGCVCQGMCRMGWYCIASSFSACEHGRMLVWNKIRSVKRVRKEWRCNNEQYFYSSSSDDDSDSIRHRYLTRSSEFDRSCSRRSEGRRKIYLERSLRPRNHRVLVGISRHSLVMDDKGPRVHHRHEKALRNIKVTHTSRFVHKGSGRMAAHRRW